MTAVAYLATPCMHCDDAPCIKAAPAGAIYKREDGLVIIDPEKAKGHPEIVESCPYGVIYWSKAEKLAQKCTGCAHLIDEGWTQTRCSQVCPTEAMKLVLADDAEMAALVNAEGLEAYRADLGTNPRVFYKNLHLWTKAFVAGSAVFADTGECAESVTVVAMTAGGAVGQCITNNFGDFRIEKLEPGQYSLVMTAAGYRSVTTDVTVGPESTTVAPVFLQRA